MGCVIVAGPPRTGTSLTMSIVHQLGYWVGDPEDMRSGPDDHDYRSFKAQQYSYQYEHRALKEFSDGKLLGRVALQRVRGNHENWAIKVPRTHTKTGMSLLALPELDDARIVITQRAVLRNKLIDIHGIYREIDRLVRGRATLHVQFETYFVCPRKQVNEIAEFVGTVATPEAVNLIDPSKRHF